MALFRGCWRTYLALTVALALPVGTFVAVRRWVSGFDLWLW
jgi:hypothetical protein